MRTRVGTPSSATKHPGENTVSEYPRLKEMGIDEPHRITGYVVNSIHRVDILRIRQKREPGSLLPVRRSWEFPRIQLGLDLPEHG